MLIGLSTYAAEKNFKLNRHLEIMTAGAPPAPRVIENMESVGANITQTYGLTEVFGPHSMCKWQEKWHDLPAGDRALIKARQGVPYVNAMHMDVVDSVTMAPVPRDGQTIGEIVMRGNNVMLGYYKDGEATDQAFTGGWFHSGDLAVMHPDGYIQIMDRRKISLSAGVKIFPLLRWKTPFINIRMCWKWPWSPRRIRNEGGRQGFCHPQARHHADPGRYHRLLQEHMARFKAPKMVEFGDLPKTATGKNSSSSSGKKNGRAGIGRSHKASYQ
ncbi:MAG: AMP-binding protein [Desulfobacterales bacterium]